jgi:hypothetical protein
MITLREQLKDPIFRAWFAKPPKEVQTAAVSPPWYVYVQKVEGGPWSRTEVGSYVQGYRFIARNLKKFHDMALSHKRREFKPPVVRDGSGKRKYHLPEAPGHLWCPYCRRMTRFGYFRRHHAMPPWSNSGERRCMICGIRLEAVSALQRRWR